MRICKNVGCISGNWVWVVVFGVSLVVVLLGGVSGPYLGDIDGYSGGIESINVVPSDLRSGIEKGPPVLAYWISGTSGESKKMVRLLRAIYHPRNQYLLQLGNDDSSYYERRELGVLVASERLFQAYSNVHVVGRSYALDQMGSSALAATLRAAALLLKIDSDWDWFITLTTSDYPLITQDDLLHAFNFLPRDLNFVHFYTSNDTSWKEVQKINQIVVDPNLYFTKSTPIFYSVESRAIPDAFKIFEGSPWVTLTRAFMEFCIKGWDNLPRKLLMYFTNVAFPLESYFQTVICNSPEFQNTTMDSDLRYNFWDSPTQKIHQVLNMSHYDKMVANGAVFARPFEENDPMLSRLDRDVLNRLPEGTVPGYWCLDRSGRNSSSSLKSSETVHEEDVCSTWGDINSIKPGSYGLKLGDFFSKLAAEGRLRTNSCHNNAA